jgi:transcriptional regulator with XRE-family HTH domain|nr:MAG TPA_asm: helix-turn-helix domain protein [Caudoviricetes sp.]
MYKNLKAEIARAGLTNSEMADAIGVKYGTLWRLLSGKRQFRLGEMMAIQSELEGRNDATYTLDYLFGDGDENGEGQSDEGAHDGSVRPD